ncbi:hypothetical protein BC830DRAFT_1128779 [Chytriomyces sp. MP71]|nr:hypothetical protein BC830DRAFT_1128779 [Chytriomyces sp. MP71]
MNRFFSSGSGGAEADARRRRLQVALLVVVTAVTGVTVYYVLFSGSSVFSNRGLSGCYDSSGSVYDVIGSGSVDQNSAQCKAILALASAFGFSVTNSTTCAKTTLLSAPASNSQFSALFCDTGSVYNVTVRNPPIPIAALPSALTALSDLAVLEMHNALFGATVMAPLISFLTTPKYLQILDLSGSVELANNASRVLSGTIPDFSSGLISRSGFLASVLLQNNNFSGPLTQTLADTMARLSLENNTHLTMPLPTPYFSGDRWTQTKRCSFANTSICLPSGRYELQPACLQGNVSLLPSCDSGPAPQRDPIDPLAAASTSNWYGGNTYQIISTVLCLILLVCLIALYGWHQRRMRRQLEQHFSGGRHNESGMELAAAGAAARQRRETDFEPLPEYFPDVPKYETLSKPAGPTATESAPVNLPLSQLPTYAGDSGTGSEQVAAQRSSSQQ